MRLLLSPRMIGVHLLALVLVGIAGGLAAWQYDAWQARRSADAVDLTVLAAVPLGEVIGPDDPFPGDQVGQPVQLSGTWLDEGTVSISDREQDGVAGSWLVTPLEVADTGSALPVVRGWLAEGEVVPAPPTGEASMVGYLQPSEGRTISDDDPTDDVLPQLRTADLLQRVDQDLYGAYAVVAPRGDPVNAGTAGLAPADLDQLPEVGRFTALRNLLYAIEWVVFGGFAGFIWWRYVQDTRAGARRGAAAGNDESGDAGEDEGEDEEPSSDPVRSTT